MGGALNAINTVSVIPSSLPLKDVFHKKAKIYDINLFITMHKSPSQSSPFSKRPFCQHGNY